MSRSGAPKLPVRRSPSDGSVQSPFMASELASELYCDERLTGDGHLISLDIPGSVSGLTRLDMPEVSRG